MQTQFYAVALLAVIGEGVGNWLHLCAAKLQSHVAGHAVPGVCRWLINSKHLHLVLMPYRLCFC